MSEVKRNGRSVEESFKFAEKKSVENKMCGWMKKK